MRFAKRFFQAFGAFTHHSVILRKHFTQGSPHIKREGSSALFVLFAYV
jgi:hypothetical protein